MSEWWHELSLAELDDSQWELLCDGCAQCCLHKLQHDTTEEIFYTRIRCRLLDDETGRCNDYAQRSVLVPDCVRLERHTVDSMDWLPATCAYRLRANGENLPAWHHLVSGSRDTVHAAGISLRGRTVSEEFIHPDSYDEHIVTWVESGERRA